MKLNVAAVTTSHPPQSTRLARTGSVRAARRVNHSPATSSSSAVGSSQPIWPPISSLSSRPEAGLAPHAAVRATAADRADLVAGEPAEAVVAERQLEDRVVLAAADVGAAARRPERDDRDPPAGRGEHRAEPDQQVTEPLEERGVREEQVDQAERGDHQERLQHLGEEGQPDQRARQREPADRVRRTRLDRAQGGVRRPDQQQREQRVRVVEPEHQHRHRRGRQHHAGEQAGRRRPRRTPDRGVEQPDRRHALQGLRDQQAPGRQPEDPDRQRHRPQRERRLVDSDGVRRVRGAEEERLP